MGNVTIIDPLACGPELFKKVVDYVMGERGEVSSNSLKVIVKNDMKLWHCVSSSWVVDKNNITTVYHGVPNIHAKPGMRSPF